MTVLYWVPPDSVNKTAASNMLERDGAAKARWGQSSPGKPAVLCRWEHLVLAQADAVLAENKWLGLLGFDRLPSFPSWFLGVFVMMIFLLTETMVIEKQNFSKCGISITSKPTQSTKAHNFKLAHMRAGYTAAWLFNIYISSTDFLSKF